MNEILHSKKQFMVKTAGAGINSAKPVDCPEEFTANDSHFIAALVNFNATVERTVSTTYSLSQFNPVTATYSYRFDMAKFTDTFHKPVHGVTGGVTPFYTATVAFLFNRFCKINTMSSRPVTDCKAREDLS